MPQDFVSRVHCMSEVHALDDPCLPVMCSVPSLAGIPFPGTKAEIQAGAELIEMDTRTCLVCLSP